jgi:glycosyltransferase involved in cell wall biosynthesis
MMIPINIIKAIRATKPDIVWFNITLGNFGHTFANLAGLMTPVILRASGVPVLITLHNMVELIGTNVKFQGGIVTRLGAQLATKMLVASGPVCVLLPQYKEILQKKYHARKVFVMPHGTLGTCNSSEYPKDSKSLLSFGIYGTHKKLEPLLDAMRIVGGIDPSITLRVAGGSNAHSPNYLTDLKLKYGNMCNIRFVGYVPEDGVPALFADNAVVILVNQSTGGESGALTQSGQYARPVLCPDLELFRQKGTSGWNLQFFDPEDPKSIARAILTIFATDSKKRQSIGMQNQKIAAGVPMSTVAARYIDLILGGFHEEQNAFSCNDDYGSRKLWVTDNTFRKKYMGQ